jgi:hypothetical protein
MIVAGNGYGKPFPALLTDRQTVWRRQAVYRNLPQLIPRDWEEAITSTGLTPD